jgi:hypothetical protein
MAQATFNNSISAHAAPSRRHFLSQAAGVAAGGTVLALATIAPGPSTAAPASLLGVSEASPALRDAVVALRESHERLEAAKARFTADDLKMFEWRELNPEPTNRRAQKRWRRKWRDTQDATAGESWAAQIEAEKDFNAHQMAVAQFTPRDENDLMLKAAVGVVYDKEKGAYGLNVAVISYSVAFDLIKMRMPVRS